MLAPPTTGTLASRRDLTVRRCIYRRAASGHLIDLTSGGPARPRAASRDDEPARVGRHKCGSVGRPLLRPRPALLPPARGRSDGDARADHRAPAHVSASTAAREDDAAGPHRSTPRRARRCPHDPLDQRPSSGPAGRRSDGGCDGARGTHHRACAAAAWMVRVESNIPLDVHEEDRLIGTSAIDRIMLPAGSHALRLVSRPLNFEGKQTVQITGGQMKVVKPDRRTAHSASTRSLGRGPGQRRAQGETPLGNCRFRSASMKSCSGIRSSASSAAP